jgi:membrane associated rhomboid family serine protease
MHAQDTAWCYGGSAWLLPGDFLIVWGARWGPLMRAQPYRWFTSWFLHQSFVHVLSNMLLFLAVALQARACSLAAAISPL